MKRYFSLICNIFTALVCIIICFSIFIVISSKSDSDSLPNLFGYTPLSVLSGSMRPVMEPGDMIITKKVQPQEIEVGDIITYKVSKDTLVTHRVIDIINTEGRLMFKTQGDANNTEDGGAISSENLVGRLAFKIPYGGHISNFARSTKGFVIFIIIPAVLLIVSLIRDLLSELGKEKPMGNP